MKNNMYKLMICLVGVFFGLVVHDVQSQENPDLPYESGSTGADGPLSLPQNLPTRWEFASAYDAERDEIIMHGGDGRAFNDPNRNARRPDTWGYNGTEWILKDTDTFVSARYRHAMAYHAEKKYCLMFGGRRADNTIMSDTWKWDGEDWELLEPETSPAPREYHKMTYDTVNKRILLVGGNPGLNELWAWDDENEEWSQIISETNPNLGSADYIDIAFEQTTGRLVAYSGWTRQTWVYADNNWQRVTTGLNPNTGNGPRMEYDTVNQEIIMVGEGRTWKFKSNEWSDITPSSQFGNVSHGGIVWCAGVNRLVHFNGWRGGQVFMDAYSFDGSEWNRLIGQIFLIDMNLRPSGVWNYTSIFIPRLSTVRFIKSPANKPVIWLATENIQIDGVVDLNGQNAPANTGTGVFAKGGPGGFDGGLGGIRRDVSGTFAGTPGQGPGGGSAPSEPRVQGEDAKYFNFYGNSLIQPLIGGSGGGGGSSNETANGGNGGAGGGAILAASSKDIIINGTISARGGTPSSHTSRGGYGSGGSARLVADRVTGSGNVDVRNAVAGNGDTRTGRVRIEAFFRPFAPNSNTSPSVSAPISTFQFDNEPSLRVISVSGQNVAENPTGSINTPDVVFTEAGEITVIVQGVNVPPGTPITLRVTTSEGTINLPGAEQPPVPLGADGFASFLLTVPAGLGTVQAFAEFNLGN